MKRIPLIKFTPAIIWFLIVLILICIPGADVTTLDPWIYKLHPDKWVHATMFGVMGWLFILPFYKTDWQKERKIRIFLLITCLVIVWGFITECIQLYVPGRDFDLLDWGADSMGALLAFYWLKKHINSDNSQTTGI